MKARGFAYDLGDGALEKDGDDDFYFAKKKVNSKDYFFNNRGEMLSDFVNVVETDDASVIKALVCTTSVVPMMVP